MALQLQCGECSRTLQVKAELAGKRVKCPCGAVVAVPRAGSVSPAATVAASGPRTARPQLVAAAANAAAAGSDLGDLGDLFDELTESDLKPRATRDREAAEAQAAVKDPLAAYREVKPGKKAKGAGGSRSTGTRVLAVLSIVIGLAALGLGAVLFFAPQQLDRFAQSVPQIKTHGTVLGGSSLALGVLGVIVGLGLLVFKPLLQRLSKRTAAA